MKADIIWLQEERLSEELIKSIWLPKTQLVYIFDDTWLRLRKPSLKRLQFIYEVLLALPFVIDIYRGDPAVILSALAGGAGVNQVYTFSPKDPELKVRVQQIANSLGVQILTPTPWIPKQTQSYRSFFKYYNSVKNQAIKAARDLSL